MTNDISHRIAEFASGSIVPTPDVRRMMQLSVFDWAACGLAGSGEPVSQIVHRMATEEAGDPQATVFGGGKLPTRAAALVNGTTSHALDYDDTHFGHIGHPSVAVIPAVLALAEKHDVDGERALEAALVGVETSIRLGIWLGRAHYQTGFHQTATAGCFGAAAGAGRILGLSKEQMEHALGLAATRASGLKSQFGTMGKPYNAGIAAASGTEVALLAGEGFQSQPRGIEMSQGFADTHAGERDVSALEGLGVAWEFENVSHKFHACCHGTHAMIEALSRLATDAPHDIARIEVRTHPRWLSVCNQPAPETGLGVKFSYRMIAAMVLSGKDTSTLSSFSDATAMDTELHELRDKVHVVSDDTLSELQSHVIVTSGAGETAEASFDLAAKLTLAEREKRLFLKAESLLVDRAKSLRTACLGDSLSLPDLTGLVGGQ